MTKKSTSIKEKNNLTFIVIISILVVFICGFVGYRLIGTYNNKNAAQHVMPYVDGGIATERVSDFYHQLITNPSSKQSARQQLLSFYGTKNLLFYDQYYQHGFDPLTCSTVLPAKVTASLVSTGPVANINVNLQFPDNSSSNLMATAVLSTDGLRIDSITCPGEKGNLAPVTAQQ